MMTASWKDLGITGKMKVRDLWKHADEGIFAGMYSVEVPSHAAVVIKISKL